MQNIIYKSENIIPWDTQSAFKMTSYKATKEENMVFCYLKAYVHQSDLVLCSYCFVESPVGDDNIQLYINLSPEKRENILKLTFGYDGMGSIQLAGQELADKTGIEYHSFKTDDEQGFYWCGETVIKKAAIEKIAGSAPKEKDIIMLNMVQTFENGDFSVLYGDALEKEYNPRDNMNVFVVLNY